MMKNKRTTIKMMIFCGGGGCPLLNVKIVIISSSLNDESHVLSFHCWHFLPYPQGIVNGKSINCDGEMFCVHLTKAFSARVVPNYR